MVGILPDKKTVVLWQDGSVKMRRQVSLVTKLKIQSKSDKIIHKRLMGDIFLKLSILFTGAASS